MSKTAYNNGIFLGITLMICSYILSLINSDLFITHKPQIHLFIFILIFYKTGSELRATNDGIIDFGTAFKNIFWTGLIAVVISTIFEHILIHYINPELGKEFLSLLIEGSEETKKLFGESFEPYLNESMKAYEQASGPGLGFTLANLFLRILSPVLLFSALVALIVNRSAPIQKKS